ncbi:MAG: ABC transporter ATP-binding protein [Bacteroidota bacterium]
MKSLLRLLAYVKNYKPQIAGHLISNILTVFFSVFSVPALIPFLNILFGVEAAVAERPEWQLNAASIQGNINYWFSQFIANHGKEQALIYACGFIIIVFFFKNLFRYLALVFMTPVRSGIVRDIRQKLYEKTMNLPLAYFSETRKGDMMSRVTADVQEVEWSVLGVLETAVREPLMLLGALGTMLFISSKLTFFVFILILFTALVIGGLGRMLRKQSGAAQRTLGTLVARLEETLSGLRIIKAFGAENYQFQQFQQTNNTYRQWINRLLWRTDLSSPLSEFLGVLTFSFLIWYGFREVNAGMIEISTFFAFLYAFFLILEPSKKLSKSIYRIQKGMAAIDRIDDILDTVNPIQEPSHPIRMQDFSYQIAYENVTFAYEGQEKPALNQVSLSIPKGKSIALVGSSGAGKSTFIDLLPRFYDPQVGKITIDGRDIKQLSISSLRKMMSVVSQEAILFNDSIYNNIVFGMEAATKAQVIEAAKIANAHDFILASEQGYQTNIGDRGTKLSGGQRQRLTIARAILRNPPILILDEATSALDSESEKLVQDALIKVMQNRTTIVVAHRLSTIQHADQIVVMKDGQIIEQGSHFELLEQGGEYQKLVALQAI